MADVYRAYRTGIMYKTESTYGTAVTVDAAIPGRVTAFSSDWANNFHRIQGIGEGRNQTTTLYGNFDCGGRIEGIVAHDFSFFVHAIGAKSGAGSSGDPYLLTEGDEIGFTGNDIASFTMQCFSDGSTDMVDTYEGCLLNNLTFTCAEGDVLRFSADWIAETFVTNTSGVAYSADTTAVWNFAQGALKWGASPTEETQVVSASITISNNLHVYRALGSRFIQQPLTGNRRYDFTATIRMNDSMLSTLQQDFMGQANTPHLAQSSSSPTASLEFQLYFEGPTNQKAYIQLDEGAIESFGKPVDVGGGLIECTIGGFAMKGLSNTPIKWQTSA